MVISLYLIGPVNRSYYLPALNVAFRHPGRAAWTVVREQLAISSGGKGRCCVAYHCITARQVEDDDATDGHGDRRSWSMPHESGKVVHSSYLLESRGELLWALVHVNKHYCTYSYRVEDDLEYHSVGRFIGGLLVSVYALQQDVRWVKRDDPSLVDRTMFLGHPTSFAVDAARFGASGGGCAYLVIKSKLYGRTWSKSALERCRVFRYNFNNSKAELVEQLPVEWSDEACMWFNRGQPQKGLSLYTVRQESHNSDPISGFMLVICHGRLIAPNLDSSSASMARLQTSGSCTHIKTKRSRGFGFVTMATTVDDEPAHVIAMIDGQILDGRPLRVKFSDQK
ncbi:hypothetical protein SETIT_9G291300v2 [Setaria italica]|uniref:RRM domain-containing protein n=1 Tax=Setaria italica TaxID=4555 RepID=A0A368SLW5_SETIT|nr:hypothetical protein SETIT_9G291300v2 [Setaria italica]